MSSLFKKYPFELEPLKYDLNQLEPYIDAKTVEIHHDRHQQNYVNSLNAVLEKFPEYQDWTLDDFFRKETQIYAEARTQIMRNAGGIFNHEEYFSHITPNAKSEPEGELADAIVEFFGSFENLKKEFIETALGVFGSGYAYLIVTPQSWLQIISLSNQETPVAYNYTPIVIADVWEHAYYLGYQNKRADYLENLWNLIDWEQAEKIFEKINEKNKKFEFGF